MKTRKEFVTFLALALPLSSIFSFLSWILSKRDILPSESQYRWGMNLPSVAKAGFPFHAFELPQPPLGSDFIPHKMISGLILNELIWIAIGMVVAWLIITRYTAVLQTKTVLLLSSSGIFFILLHLILFALWFD